MKPDQITTIIILPANPEPSSNGIQTYLSLVYELRTIKGVLYTSGAGVNNARSSHYASSCEGNYIPEDLVLQDKSILEDLRLVILPDHIDGLSCEIYDYLRCEPSKEIVFLNLVLAPLYVFADKSVRPISTMYDERDLFIYFNKYFDALGNCMADIYQEPAFDYLQRMPPPQEANTHHNGEDVEHGYIAIYAGKGHYAVEPQTADSIQEINAYADHQGLEFKLATRTSPSSKEEYLSFLSKSMGIILLDPFTNVIRDCLMLGLPVFTATPGIDYDCYGATGDPIAFIDLFDKRNFIRESAWERHYRLSRLNLAKKSLFYESVRGLLFGCRTMVGKVLIPYQSSLHEASAAMARSLSKYCVVGELSTATHAVSDASHALEILMCSDTSDSSAQYRMIANRYFEDDMTP